MVIKNTKKFYIDLLITLVFMFGFGLLPAPAPLTAVGMKVIGIFLGCIYAWTKGDAICSSVLALLALGLLPGNTINAEFVGGFGHPSVLLVVWCLIFTAALVKSGLVSVLAAAILKRKFVTKSPWILATAFFATAAILGAVIASLPVAIFLWSLYYEIAKKAEIPPKSPYTTIVMVGIIITSLSGNNLLPSCVIVQSANGIATSVAADYAFNYGPYFLVCLAINVVLVFALGLVYKLTCKNFKMKEFDSEEIFAQMGATKLTKTHMVVLAVLALVIAMVVAPSILPDSGLKKIIANFGVTGTMALGTLILCFVCIENRTLADIGHFMSTQIPWATYFMLAASFQLVTWLTSDATGVAEALKMILGPLMEGTGVVVFLIAWVVIGCVLTNIFNNMVVLAITLPIVLTFSIPMGISTGLVVGLLAIAAYQGVVMPSGSVMGALLHSNTEWLTPGMIYKYAIIGQIVFILVVCAVGIPLGLAIL